VKELDRDQLRRLVNEARRAALDKARLLRKKLNDRTSSEIKRDTADRKAIFAAQVAHDTGLDQLAVVARCGSDVYLVSVGMGCARVLDLRGRSPLLSAPENIYAILETEANWLPFDGDSEPIIALVAQMIDSPA
jgi:hypothetical protein